MRDKHRHGFRPAKPTTRPHGPSPTPPPGPRTSLDAVGGTTGKATVEHRMPQADDLFPSSPPLKSTRTRGMSDPSQLEPDSPLELQRQHDDAKTAHEQGRRYMRLLLSKWCVHHPGCVVTRKLARPEKCDCGLTKALED